MDEPATTSLDNGFSLTKQVRNNLIFFLGLVPLAIAAMRIYLMAQGDISVMLTLIKTLDVKQMFLGTFIRVIGLFGVATTAYVFCRELWPRWTSRTGSERVGVSVLLGMVFLASLGCLYPEQFWDGIKADPGPEDILRCMAWVIAGLVLPCTGRFAIRRGIDACRQRRQRQSVTLHMAVSPSTTPEGTGQADPAPTGPPATSTSQDLGWWRALGRDLRFVWSPEVLLLAPIALYLFWTFLVTNDRMWMPAQLIVVKPAAQEVDPEFAVPRSDGNNAFIGFILAIEGDQETILRPSGGVLLIKRDNLVGDPVSCQFEPDRDPDMDRPLIAYLPPFTRIPSDDHTHPCVDVLNDQPRSNGSMEQFGNW